MIFSVVARNSSMKCSIRIFEKSHVTPKSRLNVFLKVKLSNMTDWHTSYRKNHPISEIWVQSKRTVCCNGAFEYATAPKFFYLKSYGPRKSQNFYVCSVSEIFSFFLENYPAKPGFWFQSSFYIG